MTCIPPRGSPGRRAPGSSRSRRRTRSTWRSSSRSPGSSTRRAGRRADARARSACSLIAGLVADGAPHRARLLRHRRRQQRRVRGAGGRCGSRRCWSCSAPSTPSPIRSASSGWRRAGSTSPRSRRRSRCRSRRGRSRPRSGSARRRRCAGLRTTVAALAPRARRPRARDRDGGGGDAGREHGRARTRPRAAHSLPAAAVDAGARSLCTGAALTAAGSFGAAASPASAGSTRRRSRSPWPQVDPWLLVARSRCSPSPGLASSGAGAMSDPRAALRRMSRSATRNVRGPALADVDTRRSTRERSRSRRAHGRRQVDVPALRRTGSCRTSPAGRSAAACTRPDATRWRTRRAALADVVAFVPQDPGGLVRAGPRGGRARLRDGEPRCRARAHAAARGGDARPARHRAAARRAACARSRAASASASRSRPRSGRGAAHPGAGRAHEPARPARRRARDRRAAAAGPRPGASPSCWPNTGSNAWRAPSTWRSGFDGGRVAAGRHRPT